MAQFGLIISDKKKVKDMMEKHFRSKQSNYLGQWFIKREPGNLVYAILIGRGHTDKEIGM